MAFIMKQGAMFERSIGDESQPKKRNKLKTNVNASSSMGKVTFNARAQTQ